MIPRDHHDRTPLHMAAVNGSERCVEYILQAHPESLNALDKHQVKFDFHTMICWPGRYRSAYLHVAISQPSFLTIGITRLLHRYGFSATSAMQDISIFVIPMFIYYNVLNNVLTSHFFVLQNTALNLAANTGHASLVSYLLSVKEQDILLNKYNQNVLDLAISNDKEEVAMAIIEHSR